MTQGTLWRAKHSSLLHVCMWVILFIGELFLQVFDIFFAQFFNLPYFRVFFSECVKFIELDVFASGEFHEE